LLRSRLTRRGLTLAGVTLGATAASPALAAIPPALAEATMQSAGQVAAGTALSTAASASVAAMAEGTLRRMWLARAAVAVLVLTAIGVPLIVLGAGLAFVHSRTDQGIETPTKAEPRAERTPVKAEPITEIRARIRRVEPHDLVVVVDGVEHVAAVVKETQVLDPKGTPLKDGLRNLHIHAGVEVLVTFAEKNDKKVYSKVKLTGK
jgi:hypothetical protein